ncbi:MAG TPA: DUF302 domain-containing protein [Solirubrobacteraceae bacterium]|nr:DUF302 domain-containing protein [Solirubrobacteraceae bacterium]
MSGSGTGIETKDAAGSVDEVTRRLTAAAEGAGLTVFAVIDHAGEAKAHGLQLRDTKVVIFGSPDAGTPVMQAVPLAALDLPLKVLVWRDHEQTKMSYLAPAAFAARYGLTDELAARLAGIDALTDRVAGA